LGYLFKDYHLDRNHVTSDTGMLQYGEGSSGLTPCCWRDCLSDET